MRFLKVLSIKMGVFMDKIEFFLYIAEPSGVLGAASGVRVGKEQPEWWPTKLPAALLMSLPASLLSARLALLPVHIPESG